eukprot:5256587-Alexandrium_andersonii.AAC.1
MQADGGELITCASVDDATAGLPAARELARAAEAWLVGDGSDLSLAYQTAAEVEAEESDAS